MAVMKKQNAKRTFLAMTSVVVLIAILLWAYFMFLPRQNPESEIHEKCASLSEGQSALVDIAYAYKNIDRICVHDSYADKHSLNTIYGIDGDLFDQVKDGDLAVYAVSGRSVLGRLYLSDGFSIKKPVSSGCKFGTSFSLKKMGKFCFINLNFD